jgi:hypothetical protein
MSCNMGAPSCPTCLAHTACCSIALGFGGVTHGDSESEPIGGARSGINGKHNRAKDGLNGVTHRVSNDETISGANVGERRRSTR